MSGNLFQQEGILIGTDYQRINGRLNVDHKMSKKLTIGTSIGLSRAQTNRVEGDQSLHGPLPNGISTPAIFPVFNEDGTYNQEGPYSNAVSIANEAINQNFSFRTISNVYADYKILPGLTLSTKWGADFLNFREHAYESIKTVQGAKFNGLGFETYTNVLNVVSNNFLRYQKSIKKHSMEVMGGYSFERYENRSSFIRAQDFADPGLQYINSATTIVSASTSGFESGIRSFFGRANYNFDNKYLFTFSGRLDGSSRFGENNRNGFFPAASAAWRIGEESFFKVKAISELKIRASYGLTGNDDIPQFLFAALYGITAYGGQPGVFPNNIPNPDLKWETTAQTNLGLDIGLFDNKITATIDLYDKQTKDLLLSRPLPTSSGFSVVTQNVGRVQNRGIELSLTTDNLPGRTLSWNTRLNISANRNKVLELYNNQPIDDLGRGSNRIEEGQPIGIFYNYEWLGVDPSTGDVVYADKNFDGEITTDDRTMVGNPHPDFIGGITNTFEYKGIDLSIFFQGSYGNDMFNGSRLFLESLQGGDNQLEIVNRRWQKPGDITPIPDATNDPVRAASNRRSSSRFIEDGSYLRLKNLTLGYSFNKDLLRDKKISGLRLYFSGQNLLTFTNYSGLDPEVNYRGNENAVIGTDFFTYPQARAYTFGLNLTF
jgi:TonB-linked SusC/RagA family outer membrane protein